MPFSRQNAAGTIVNTIHKQPLGGLWIPHANFSPKCKAFRIFQVLLPHGAAGTVRLIFHIAEHFIQNRQLVILIDQSIFVGQRNVFFPCKNRIRRVLPDDLGSINQLLVTAAAGGSGLCSGQASGPLAPGCRCYGRSFSCSTIRSIAVSNCSEHIGTSPCPAQCSTPARSFSAQAAANCS